MVTTPARINVKKRPPTHGGDFFGFVLGGGWRRTRFDFDFGIWVEIVTARIHNLTMAFVRFFGKLLISLGVGVLMFVAWTLWGTGLLTARYQATLEQAWAGEPPIETVDKGDQIKVPESFLPAPGEGVFRLRIPQAGVNEMVVEGVDKESLYKGPGHYPSCRDGFERPLCTEFEEIWPGENGRVIVSGHRTTYGAPFFDLDKLEPGDKIFTDTQWGDFTYEVTRLDIVEPDSLAIVIQNDDQAEIVLTTCNPKYSAAQRLIVYAKLLK